MKATMPLPASDHDIDQAPYYLRTNDEVQQFEAAFKARLPVMLKGPTGCGKTRFVEFMAHRLGRPLVTVACHEDLFASDLLGRYLLKNDETVWVDGPLTTAVRTGAICYLDEIVEARKDTTVIIHSLTDDRRLLYIDKTGEVVPAHENFMMVLSYNPGYQSVLKDLKQSTRQRFVALEFGYPGADLEATIVERESGLDAETAARYVRTGFLWNTGIFMRSRRRRSTSKHSGALMSSRLIPPNVGAIHFTVSIKACGESASTSMSMTSMLAKRLNSTALPSMTGLAASGPAFPRPRTAVPSVITATRFPLPV